MLSKKIDRACGYPVQFRSCDQKLNPKCATVMISGKNDMRGTSGRVL